MAASAEVVAADGQSSGYRRENSTPGDLNLIWPLPELVKWFRGLFQSRAMPIREIPIREEKVSKLVTDYTNGWVEFGDASYSEIDMFLQKVDRFEKVERYYVVFSRNGAR